MLSSSLGPVIGRAVHTADGTASAYLGLRYAEPPVGDLRFAPARLWSRPWTVPHDATVFGAPCHQSAAQTTNPSSIYWDEEPNEHPQTPPLVPPPSEDCLNLNIWRPFNATGRLLPVLVWVHGGGFCGGAASSKWTDGARLAAGRDLVVVSLNYRLGPLGFLAHPELKRDFGATGGLNGVHDQLVGLRWVQAHIASFGGDPRQVTLYGESSGGVSVCVLNASPRARGLFQRAIISSGPCIVPSEGWGPATLADGYRLGV